MGIMQCPECKCTISDDVEFCPGCGHPVKTRSIYPGRANIKAMSVRCPWCDEMIPAGAKKCPGCGSPAKVTYDTSDGRSPRGGKNDDWNWESPDHDKAEDAPKKLPVWVFILIVLLLIAVFIWSYRTLRRAPSGAASVILGGLFCRAPFDVNGFLTL
ncbi:MAG: zinc ribbon domain-containing protein [Oscillospiraceae bacterium]|nr:zinc ribbon domain-containing protein [Oscillospiraceae bacterium]